MRALALLLLAVNLGYFAWAVWIDEPLRIPLAANEDLKSAPQLVLASERVPVAELRPPIVSTPALPPPSTSRCVSLGPFQDLPTVTQASATLTSAGHDPRQRLEQGEVWVGHWVSIAGFSTHDQAQSAVERLKQRGVNDAYILPGTDPPNVISLGVFKDQTRAQRRYNEAKSIGLPVTIADRTRSGSVYWVDVQLKEGATLPDVAALSAQPGKILRLESRPCPMGPSD